MGHSGKLGFCFSFPCEQTSLRSGTLIHWTKGFRAEGAEGKDVVKLLESSLRRVGVKLEVAALINDTVGTLAASAYKDPDAAVGLILATGSNACYVEPVEGIPKWDGTRPSSGKMVINIEWGDFDSALLPRVPEDYAVDAATLNPGRQPYEKLLSGTWLITIPPSASPRAARQPLLREFTPRGG